MVVADNAISVVSLILGSIAFLLLIDRIGIDGAFNQILVWIAALGFIIPILKRIGGF